MLDKAIARVLISEDEIRRRTTEMGEAISREYDGRDLTLICVLKGGVVFLADLIRSIRIPCASTSWPRRATAPPPDRAAWCGS